MTIKEYQDRCIRAAIRLGKYFRFYEAEFSPDELVIYDGITYYPEKLIVGYDRHGMSVHTCRLHSLTANSTVETELGRVEGKLNEKENQSNN